MARVSKQPRVKRTYSNDSWQVEYDNRLFYITCLYDYERKKRYVEDMHWFNSGTVEMVKQGTDDWHTIINLIDPANELDIDRQMEAIPQPVWDRIKVGS
jgi:hypothetical protein|tara:strand:+ start:783 stop:1079 length:297 start_codon:yes stop_codon:yes gene_type:complete